MVLFKAGPQIFADLEHGGKHGVELCFIYAAIGDVIYQFFAAPHCATYWQGGFSQANAFGPLVLTVGGSGHEALCFKSVDRAADGNGSNMHARGEFGLCEVVFYEELSEQPRLRHGDAFWCDKPVK